jgi:hypothetical protein
MVPWVDRGLTMILGLAILVACLLPARAQLAGVLGLVTAVAYVGIWGVLAVLTR